MKLLDLFCGAGGCSRGYYLAGFTDITGVDCDPQPRYPYRFVQSDALAYLAEHGHEYDAIHASPPCQCYSRCKRIGNAREGHPDLLAPTREALVRSGKPWVIENVEGAPMHGIRVCGTALGLRVRRHRLFESSVLLFGPGECRHAVGDVGVYAGKIQAVGTRDVPYKDSQGRTHYRPVQLTVAEGRQAMGIDWMSRDELSQAIPPAYTEYVGKQVLRTLAG